MDRRPSSNLPVPYAGAHQGSTGRTASGWGAAACGLQAHRLGQEGARRGLRGGPPVLAAADRAYLAAEWSGSADRRAAQGRYASIAA